MGTPASFRAALVAAALLVAVPAVLADEIINRTTGVPYPTIQDAVDAASPGDVIFVDGGDHPPIVIDKPIYITGDSVNRPLLREYQWYEPLYVPTHPTILLVGPGAGTVTISGFDFGGITDIYLGEHVAPAIQGGGFDELRILHCNVKTQYAWPYAGAAFPAQPGIDVDIDYLLIEDSTVLGGFVEFEGGAFVTYSADGGPAILTTGDIGVFDSTVTGGAGMDLDAASWPAAQGCDEIEGGGAGGVGISTPGTLYRAGSSITGGAGAMIVFKDVSTGATADTCYKPDGPDVMAGNVVTLANNISASGPVVLNNAWTLTWYTADPGSVLVFGVQPMAPLQLYPEGHLFMNPTSMKLLFAPAPGLSSLTYTVGPSGAGLVGYPLVVQRYNATEGLSRPVFAAILEE